MKVLNQKFLIFTPTLFFEYAVCPHWIWHDRFSNPRDKGEMPELTLKLFEQGVLHEQDYIKDLTFTPVKSVNLKQAFKMTLELMALGAELIYQGVIQYQADGVLYQGRPDLLRKLPGQSQFGDYYYQPIEIKSTKEIHLEQKYQLVLYGFILEKLQGIFPSKAAIINRDKEEISLTIDAKEQEKTVSQIENILSIIRGNKPPLRLVSSYKQSPWYNKCVAEAETANDIALLYHLDCRAHPALRNCGINTVVDAAKIDINLLPKIPYTSQETLERIKLQAQSLIDGKLKWLAKPNLPDAPLKIFFDIEGDPLLQIQYMFGFWIAGDSEFKYAQIGHVRKHPTENRYFLYFLAEDPEEEETLWKKFLAWLEVLPEDNYTVFHYANYEKCWTKKLADKYGSSRKFQQFHSRLFDLENVRKKSVIFPLYFYSIKDIAKSKFVNFKWRHTKAGGAQSIFWYEKWLEEADCDVLNDIIDYNEDDVRATEYFYTWLKKFTA
jgi:predicted RecB family nuclease